MRRDVEQGLRQKLAVGEHDNEVGPQFAELGMEGFMPGALRLEHGQAEAEGELLHGRRLELEVAAPGLVRLRDYADDVQAARGGEGLQRRTRDVRRAHEDEAQHVGSVPSEARRDKVL